MPSSMVLLARLLALSWAGFWMFFFVVESWEWQTPIRLAMPWVALGLLFVALSLLAWRSERTGGFLLLSAGLITGLAYTIWSPERLPVIGRVLTTAAFLAPPVAAGILFVLHEARARARGGSGRAPI